MSLIEEIPALSIWEALSETIRSIMNAKFSEKSLEHLSKIIKSGDFSIIFVFNRDTVTSFENYQKIREKYKAFTTWFFGRFFYLLSCDKLSKSHNISIDVQLYILDQLSKSELSVYEEVSREYSFALSKLTKFIKLGEDKLILNVFVPQKSDDLSEKVDLSPVQIEINNKKKCDEFLVKLLKFIKYMLNHSFDFENFDNTTCRNLDELLFLLSTSSFSIKIEILGIFFDLIEKVARIKDCDMVITQKMDLFCSFFEQIVYQIYNQNLEISQTDFEIFEKLLQQFLEFHNHSEINDFLLSRSLFSNKLKPNRKILKICMKKRKNGLKEFENFPDLFIKELKDFNVLTLCGLKTEILSEIKNYQNENEDVKAYKMRGKWEIFHQQILETLENTNCSRYCKIRNCLNFLTEICKIFTEIRLTNTRRISFFEETSLFIKILSVLNQHFDNNCEKFIETSKIFDLFLNLILVFNSWNVCTFFDIFCFPLTQSTISQHKFTKNADFGRYKKELNEFFKHISKLPEIQKISFGYLTEFITIVSTGLIESGQIEDMENAYFKIGAKTQIRTIQKLPNLLLVFKNCERTISKILIPTLSSSDEAILNEVTKILPKIICMASSDFSKAIYYEDNVKMEIFCDKCEVITDKSNILKKCKKIEIEASILTLILKNVLKFLIFDDSNLKIAALEVLPTCANHISRFDCEKVAKIWVQKCEDPDERVRRRFAEIGAKILKSARNDVIEIYLDFLMGLTKKSLKHSDESLQGTILLAIEEICGLKNENMILPIVKILIYLIMVPTSRHSLIAVNKFFVLAENLGTTTWNIYKQFRQEICEIIVHLCIVNEALVDSNLQNSLCKISVALEFYNAKDFVLKECQNLVPFFVAKNATKLIEQIATTINLSLPELLANIYGNIFLHIFLNGEKSVFKDRIAYLEKTTGQSGPALRKRNLWVILSELLLNFHDRKDKVLWALQLLAKEDGESASIHDYLQSRFLGLLQHFDFKLITKNSNRKSSVLLSLADLFRFMGPKHINPLRFKIIAMLRTADCSGFPELNCEIWNAFLRSCDVEFLGPQLATIFVSILPLIETCPVQINKIFKFLVHHNEESVKEFIKDLFFVDDPRIDVSVASVIKKYVKVFEDSCFRDTVKTFLKYVAHETLEIRVKSLNHLKTLMEKNREELDRLILTYNGIDPVIVELIDILMLGTREKDADLKLACGEVIGELGAIEPAHLPRRYAQNSKNFTFFINDDAFVVGALNELTKALQGEKNTVNMDRFSIAIQELLRYYDISPEKSSNRNHLWEQFQESQQELMLPLLSSRYVVAQAPETNFSCPIYGSSDGTSFQSWLYNWTQSLIAMLTKENQSVLTPCLPAMKQDNRIIMQFLPHILLHSIIHDFHDNNKEKSFIEIKTITSSFNTKKIHSKLLEVRPEETTQIQCTKVVFVVLDFLNRWIREWQWKKGMAGRNDENYSKIKIFLGQFCKLQLAKCNFHCREYPRALMYLEDYITENPEEISNHLAFLAEIYAQLDEPDGVAGVTATQQTEPTIEQRILAHEVSGKLSDAAACYERIAQPLKVHHVKGLIRCYLDLDNVTTALSLSQSLDDFETQAEPLWRLGRFEELDDLLKRPELEGNDESWGVQIGKALLYFQQEKRRLFTNTLEKLRRRQVDFLGAASLEEGSYQHGYSHISHLHALNELQQVEKATHEMLVKPNDDAFVEDVVRHLAKEWELRIKVVQESVRITEPLLCLRRVAIEQSKRVLENKVPGAIPLLNSLLGDCWMLSAKSARAAGVHQQAYTYSLKAEEFAPPRLFLEKAKLHWQREEHEQALTTLKRGVEVILPESSTDVLNALPLEKKKLLAEAKLLIASYNDIISNVDGDTIISYYRESTDVYKEWEKNWVYYAQCLDRSFQNWSKEERDAVKGGDMLVRIVHIFLKSLLWSSSFVYQSLPRVLSIWFDYGTHLLDLVQGREERRNNLVRMSHMIDSSLTKLPPYIFLTAFSQIISRICHPQKEVYMMIKSIVVKLLLHYPQQCLWTIISVMKSSYTVRAKRCAEIFADPALKGTTVTKLVRDFTNLAEKLIELCNKDIPADVETTTVSALLRGLPRMLNKSDFSEIMIPTHKFRKLVLPNPDFANSQHNPFPNHYVHIVGIEEEITVLRSLQRPRKITFRGSDGKSYIQMLKPKDDLRKDFRLMEFNDIVNQLLSHEPEARQRRLNIRLYSVSPLNEECGLIEWVPNLVGLRPIILALYKQRGISVKMSRDMTRKEDSLSKKRDFFINQLLPRYPPILGEWFRRTFPDAQSWVFARTAYIRTTAVISMVGYILGLGDRHGENILLDSICGDTVHVDFNCLFNKGETFEWPERVPFRLTQNMVAAMGPLGVEGVFRKSCACTLRVLRTNRNTLMSIVTPFVYDPLVSWHSSKNGSSSNHSTAERTNEQALDHVKNIEFRLQGIIIVKNRSRSIPLSVDGQSSHLIKEAMNVDNLCQMYSGWGAYL